MKSDVELKSCFRKILDFPSKGIIYWDITPLLINSEALALIFSKTKSHYADRGLRIDKVVAPESRGFMFGCTLAKDLGVGFVPIRKPGKLPFDVVKQTYSLEYGTDTIEMHRDAISQGDRILFVDDILATGGTARACAQLVEKQGGEIVSMSFLAELLYLPGRLNLSQYDIFSLVQFNANDLRD